MRQEEKGGSVKSIKVLKDSYHIEWIEAVDICHDNYKREKFYKPLYDSLRRARIEDLKDRVETLFIDLK